VVPAERVALMSPKVLYPFIVGASCGVVLLVAGLLAHDSELRTIGASILVAAAAHAGIGYQAPR
jgi:hypothetical protein